LRPYDADRSSRIRSPLQWKGLRTRFRTALQAPSKFKYRTDLLRGKRGTPTVLLVYLRKGPIKEFKSLVGKCFPGFIFEGWLLTIKGNNLFTKETKE